TVDEAGHFHQVAGRIASQNHLRKGDEVSLQGLGFLNAVTDLADGAFEVGDQRVDLCESNFQATTPRSFRERIWIEVYRNFLRMDTVCVPRGGNSFLGTERGDFSETGKRQTSSRSPNAAHSDRVFERKTTSSSPRVTVSGFPMRPQNFDQNFGSK